jgi:hypothetical protein
MLEINSNKKTDKENNTNDIDSKAPVISTYNQVKFDIYTLFQEFSKAYGSYKALERMNKSETKEAKHYEKLMTSYALQFHSLVAYGWNDTKKRMEQYDKLLFGEEQINKYGTIWNSISAIENRFTEDDGSEFGYGG